MNAPAGIPPREPDVRRDVSTWLPERSEARVVLAALLMLYLLSAGLHAAWVPTGQTGYQDAPDEAAHVSYALTVARGRLPVEADEWSDPRRQSYEWHQPPLYYALISPLAAAGTRAARAGSIMIGLLALLALYTLARRILPTAQDVPLVAMGIAALTPAHVAILSTVNNDGLLELLFTLALLTLYAAFYRGFTLRWSVALGVVIGAALLTKVTAMLLLPVVAVAWLLPGWPGRSASATLRSAATAVIAAAAVCGWWYARNALLLHEWIPVQAFTRAFGGTAQAADVVSGKLGLRLPEPGWAGYWMLAAQMSYLSFWAVFGTPRLAAHGIPAYLPLQLYELTGIVIAACALGWLLRGASLWKGWGRPQRAGLVLLAVTLLFVAASFAAFLSRYFQTQGRYLYPAMAPICILLAVGWTELRRPRYGRIADGLLLAYLALFLAVFLSAVQAAAS